MGLFTIIAVYIIAAGMAIKTKEDLYEIFPMTISGLILVLYGLAFLGKLSLIDWIAAGILVGLIIYVIRNWKQNVRANLKLLIGEIFSWKSILLLLAMVIITFLVKDKVAIWWDDINYWATDAKALYYNDGFAGKYGNVAPEFGDYPPAIQLFKWFFLHLSPIFREGLMFGAYHCLNLIYALPLLAKIKTKNPIACVLGLIGIFLIPGIIDGIAVEGTCADVTMGIVYGAFLWSAYDEKDHTENFYFARMTLYACILVLTKSVGIEWAFFGMVFFLLMYSKRIREKGSSVKLKLKPILVMGGTCLLTEGSWLLFCLLNRRVAKLTSTGVKIALGGGFSLPDNTMIKMGHFARGFAFCPMHIEHTWGIDLSALALLILVVVTIVIFYKIRVVEKWECKRILLFVLLTALAAYGIIFLGHLTIFAGELQYLDDAVMAKSIARYGAPFSIGLLYLLFGVFTEKNRDMKAYGICLAFILLTTSIPGTYQMMHGYRTTLQENITGRSKMIESEAKIFLEKGRNLKVAYGDSIFEKRTLYLRDDQVIHWVKDTYISYEVSPIPVVYAGISTDTMTEADMVRKIEESHAKYLYADKVEGDPNALFENMMSGNAFEYETFYEIIEDNGSMKLKKIQ